LPDGYGGGAGGEGGVGGEEEERAAFGSWIASFLGWVRQRQKQPQVLRLRNSRDARVTSLRMTLHIQHRRKNKCRYRWAGEGAVSCLGGVMWFGGFGGAGDSSDAGWGAEPVDAGGRWEALGGEVSE
jgi:hypothetical protein